MKSRDLSRFATSACIAAAMLAGCGGTQPPIGVLRTVSPMRALPQTSYKLVYHFQGGSNGSDLVAPMIDVNGTFYGTTYAGGGSGCFDRLGCGTVYSLTPSGSEKVLYAFTGGSDGSHPAAALTDVDGTLYGTTEYGGGKGCKKRGCGTVYSVTINGSEKVLHRFTGAPDGAYPVASLVNVRGTLYGTTREGGTSERCKRNRSILGCGTVYAITTRGAETVLYSFADRPDGAYPQAPLIDVNGTLYGASAGGGAHNVGTVYSVSTSGSEKVLHSFRDAPDGAFPYAGLIDVNGVLYGTTWAGGRTFCLESGGPCGTVYRVTTSGAETVLYTFTFDGRDGAAPQAGLTYVHGTLYGTTYYGGIDGVQGYGTVFSVTMAGKEHVLHIFVPETKNGNAAYPRASMIDVDGTLYGNTSSGGDVFALTP
ncbi:MAG TPA: choice-of-anchor tandem repeat GloVer-containing protein [Candidatus Cybelea sp.]|nr:choice-of-anchor tandem repeat GloVer-containing protein [Candidatus Cybelea sp.]